MADDEALLYAKILGETGRLRWPELERHFARGVVVNVVADLDLVAVAMAIARDESGRVAAWMADGRIARATADDGRRWHEHGTELWAVVTLPWVLVQERPDAEPPVADRKP